MYNSSRTIPTSGMHPTMIQCHDYVMARPHRRHFWTPIKGNQGAERMPSVTLASREHGYDNEQWREQGAQKW